MNFYSTAAVLAPRRNALRVVKALAWLTLASFAAYFLRRNAAHYFTFTQDAFGEFWPRRLWLVMHIAGAGTTLVLGLLQFIAPLRAAYPRVHRWIGRLYLLGLLVGFVGGTQIVGVTLPGWSVAVALITLEVAWLLTATVALLAILAGDVRAHRAWMVRNYILTFAFVTFRAAILVPQIQALAPISELLSTLLWLSWTAPLLLWEIVTQARCLLSDAARRRLASRVAQLLRTETDAERSDLPHANPSAGARLERSGLALDAY